MDLLSTTPLATMPAPNLPSEPKKRTRIKVIVIGPNGGGVRKTKTTLLFGSIAAAAGYKVLYVCADKGIGSLSTSLKVGGRNPVDHFPQQETGEYHVELLSRAEEVGADVVIIDLGANEMLNGVTSRTLRAALSHLRELGHETFVVLSLVAGKVGLDDDASNFANRMQKHAEILLAFHGRDEEGDFLKLDKLKADYDHVEVPTDQVGILNMITAAGVTPFEWCNAPPAGFEMAAGWMASNLHQLAQQPPINGMLGGTAAVPVIARLMDRKPEAHYTGRNAAWQVHNSVLLTDAAQILAQRALTALGLAADDASVLTAARAYIAASAERRKARLAARQAYA